MRHRCWTTAAAASVVLLAACSGSDPPPAAPADARAVQQAPVASGPAYPERGAVGVRDERGLRETAAPGGVLVLSGDVVVLTDTVVRGGIDFEGRVLRLRNVVVEGGHGWWGLVVTRRQDAVVEIVDSTLRTVAPLPDAAGVQPLGGGRVLLQRVDVSGTTDGVHLGPGSVVESSWVHDLAVTADSHNDAVQVMGGDGFVVRGNRLEVNRPEAFDPAHQNAAVFLQPLAPGGHIGGVELSGNFLMGGGYALRVEGDVRDLVVRDNVFGPRGTTVPWSGSVSLTPGTPPPRWQGNVQGDAEGSASLAELSPPA